jgi:hypothetical protein
MKVSTAPTHAPRPALGISLWIAQALLGVLFVGTGVWKLLTPVSQLAAMIPWAGQVSNGFLVTIAMIDLLGGIGVVLPSLVRIKPGLSVLAALGCALLMICAIVFHFSRGEAANTPFNFVLVGLSLFVAWGRQYRVRIAAR